GIVVAGRPVEIAVTPVSAATVRITVLPIEDPGESLGDDGALAGAEGWRVAARHRQARAFGSVRAGNLTVRFTPDPPVIHIDTAAGQTVQRLTLDRTVARLSFTLPKGPLLGLGEAGPQFDRKAS